MFIKTNTNGNNTQNFCCEKTVYVTVTPWKRGVKNQNHSIAGILKNQGFSNRQVYSDLTDGKTLLQRVALVNKLKYPNLVREGTALLVPTCEIKSRCGAPN